MSKNPNPITIPKFSRWTITCPNHPKFEKRFTNRIYAEQELSRHAVETMPRGREAKLVAVE